MTIEQAIEKARRAGYEAIWRSNDGQYVASKYPGEIWLDSLFWQSLGKALGWSNDEHRVSFGSAHPVLPSRYSGMEYAIDTWQYQWHCFIDHLAEGNITDTFFRNLG